MECTNVKCTNVNFETAFALLRAGYKIYRSTWEDTYLELIDDRICVINGGGPMATDYISVDNLIKEDWMVL